ncbi:hypothetical protein SynA18461_00344 [Synechococcus sp. A18-46.1]|nr:hypothetical protein SynA18461_00344 [Synechococcus sp. A18-46.1]
MDPAVTTELLLVIQGMSQIICNVRKNQSAYLILAVKERRG